MVKQHQRKSAYDNEVSIVKRPVDLVTEGALKKQLKADILREAIRVA